MPNVERTRTEGGPIYNVEETLSTQGQCIGKSMDQSTMWKGQGGPLYIVHCRRDRVDQSTVQRSEAVPKYTAEDRGCTKVYTLSQNKRKLCIKTGLSQLEQRQ